MNKTKTLVKTLFYKKKIDLITFTESAIETVDSEFKNKENDDKKGTFI